MTELLRQGYQPRKKKPTIPPCAKTRPTWNTRPYGRSACPSAKSDLDPAGTPSKGATYIGCHALVLGNVVVASARGNHPPLLGQLPERTMASALLKMLKTTATEVRKIQIEDAVYNYRAALAVREDPQWRGIGNLPINSRSGRRSREVGVLNSKNKGRIRW